MSDFESYLERYQGIISDFRSQYLQSHNSMSLFNSKELRALLHDDEVAEDDNFSVDDIVKVVSQKP